MVDNHRFADVYEALHDDIWLYCLRRTASPADAEDLLSETFITVFEKLGELDGRREARPWVFAIARNKVRNHQRAGRRRERFRLPLSVVTELGLARSEVGPETLALDQSDELARAFRRLTAAEQEIIALAAWEELSNREIAVMLRCSELAVRSRLFRARRKFDRFAGNAQRTTARGQVEGGYAG